MNNRYPLWKYVLLVALMVFGVIYALPNLYKDVPAVQISAVGRDVVLDVSLENKITAALQTAGIAFSQMVFRDHSLFIDFSRLDEQTKAQEVLKALLGGEDYIVAIYLMPTAPSWLNVVGAHAMRLGLDLRGGIHFLLGVDIDAVYDHLSAADAKMIAQSLRSELIRYSGIGVVDKDILIHFRDASIRDQAAALLKKEYRDYLWEALDDPEEGVLLCGSLGQTQIDHIRQNTMDQSMSILRNRVNELGISEAVVTQQGLHQIAVDLPGMQDVAQAQNIIGKTATVEFHLVDTAQTAPDTEVVLEYDAHHRPYRLYKDIVLQGAAITGATANFGEQGPEVNIKLSGGLAVTSFNQMTAQNIGKLLAVLYVETHPVSRTENGKTETSYRIEKRIINAAIINSALGNGFRITGLTDIQEASNLALLLRAGALPVPIHFEQERTIGPSLGQQNIDQGLLSVEIGFGLVVLFMAIYYRFFGVVADIALAMNLLLIVAVMSILGFVLTLPGIAGMVLTVGMAVDANVLIFERIREELRLGVPAQSAIYMGYDRAMTTIVDSNLTTLIVALVLFGLGSGPVKGFAITLTIGIVTSMVTSIFGSRAIINLVYGRRRHIQQLSIGIRRV